MLESQQQAFWPTGHVFCWLLVLATGLFTIRVEIPPSLDWVLFFNLASMKPPPTRSSPPKGSLQTSFGRSILSFRGCKFYQYNSEPPGFRDINRPYPLISLSGFYYRHSAFTFIAGVSWGNYYITHRSEFKYIILRPYRRGRSCVISSLILVFRPS